MKSVAMLLSNSYRPDPRVAREARALVGAGYPLHLVCWDRQAELAATEQDQGLAIERIQEVRTRYAAGWRQLFYLPRFGRAALARLERLRPEIVHCHDLDTLWIGLAYRRRHPLVQVVFDAHEHYPALMSLYLPAPLVRGLAWLERRWLAQADAVITASFVLADEYRARGLRQPLVTIANLAELSDYPDSAPDERAVHRAALCIDPDCLLVGYIGGFTRNRLLLPLVAALKDQPGLHLLLAGDGPQRPALQAAIAGATNITDLGWIPAGQVPRTTRLADVLVYCLVPDYPGAIYNAPNSLANAMAAGRPLIANPVGDLGRIVAETGCGVLIDPVTPESIRAAVQRLADPAERAQLGAAGRRAAETTYHWGQAAQELVQFYEQL